MAFLNKMKWILGILIVFVLIVATNLIDRNNFKRVKDSVETIYEDRLIAKDLIFQMTNSIHQKEIAIYKLDTVLYKQKSKALNSNFQNLINQFEETKLTLDEKKFFENLKSDFQKLKEGENIYVKSNYSENENLINQLNNTKKDLQKLSKIQIDEGSRQLSISKKAIDIVELFTQIEIYLLIFLAIAIQVIIMYKPKE